jgi:hypothetical protein
MGHLNYGTQGTRIDIEDRALMHLQVVIIDKLRRGESFAFSWIEPVTSGSGRSTIWLHPMVTLQFKFDGNRTPSLNSDWLAQLSTLANSNGGLRCTNEPPDIEHAPQREPTVATGLPVRARSRSYRT